MIRLLNADDAALIQEEATKTRSVPFDAARLFERENAVAVGDDADPAICQIQYYQILAPMWPLMPRALGNLLRASDGWASHVLEFWPLSASDGQKTAARLPLLATALAEIGRQLPEALTRPVWARFDGVSKEDGVALVGLMKLAFPAAATAGPVIWMDTLQGARDAVASAARQL